MILICTKNTSKELPFTVGKRYNAEHMEGDFYRIGGDDLSVVHAPLKGYFMEFMIANKVE